MKTFLVWRRLVAVLLPLLLMACGDESGSSPPSAAEASRPESSDAAPPPDSVMELDWDALIPVEWRPDKIMDEYNAEELEDDDPRAQELMDKLEELWKQSPVVQDLDGERVKLPGFIVPVETDGQQIGEFLLVPYYGACIHVPPPPANQTVHVSTAQGQEYRGELFDIVWVSGTLKVESSSSELGDAGYRRGGQQGRTLRVAGLAWRLPAGHSPGRYGQDRISGVRSYWASSQGT